MYSEIVYFSSLLICISLGSHYKKIDDKELKRNYGTGLGILIIFLVCGHHIYHSVIMTWGNIIIIKCCDKRYLHQTSLVYTWLYLAYLNYNITDAKYMLWIYQAMALRLVGLAFEINAAYRQKSEEPKLKINIAEEDSIPEDKNVMDIIAYAYCFIGLHKGPYYRWKIYNDHLNTPFGNLGDCRLITEQKLKRAAIYALIYMFLWTNFPTELYYEDTFYTEYGADMRYLYNIPQLLMYTLLYQLVVILCTAVCSQSGFGVYPAKCEALPGHGPTMKLSLLKLATGTPDVALGQEYNFSMLQNFQNEQLLMGPRMSDTLRAWDMSTRYWFWAHMFKGMGKTREGIRSVLSYVAWSLWCGPSIQQMIISCTLWVHIHLEKEYSELYDTTESMKVSWDIGFSIMRLLCLIYLTPCFILQDSSVVLRYYNSMFWVYHIVLLCVISFAVIADKICPVDEPLHPRRPGKIVVLGSPLRRDQDSSPTAGPSTGLSTASTSKSNMP